MFSLLEQKCPQLWIDANVTVLISVSVFMKIKCHQSIAFDSQCYRRSHVRLIFNMGIRIPGKTVFILRRGLVPVAELLPEGEVHGFDMGPTETMLVPVVLHLCPMHLAVENMTFQLFSKCVFFNIILFLALFFIEVIFLNEWAQHD